MGIAACGQVDIALQLLFVVDIKYADFFDKNKDIDDIYERILSELSDDDGPMYGAGQSDREGESEEAGKERADDFDDRDYDDDGHGQQGFKDQVRSSYETFQEKIKGQIQELEEENMARRPWTLAGEVSSKGRPMNSLLEEVLEFDQVAKPVPVITEKVTEDLEDLIRRKILDADFENPQRLEAGPLSVAQSARKGADRTTELSTNKPAQSLSQFYEASYAAKVLGVALDDPNHKRKLDVQKSWAKINDQLNRLCHFYYVPKPSPREDADKKDKLNVPSLLMEENLPISMNASMTLAPEEIYSNKRVPLKSKDEIDVTQRHSRHLAKKRKQRARAAEKKMAGAKKAGPSLSSATVSRHAEKRADKGVALKSLSGQKNVTILAGSSGGHGKHHSKAKRHRAPRKAQAS